MEIDVFTLRVLLALALGAVIGAERQMRQRMAGLRTNALVAAGASLFVAVAGDNAEGQARIAAQVVSGIGFLGAGVIMREGLNVRGLNTAATLWCSAAIGVLAGLGHSLAATAGAAAILGANLLLRSIGQQINKQSMDSATEVEQMYRLSIVCRNDDEVHVRTLMLHMLNGMPQLMIQSLHSEDTAMSGQLEVRADLIASPNNLLQLEQIVSRISLEKGVSAARWAVLHRVEE
ncbi:MULTISPECIES: MgtC/SapB family protein [unclassified Undibacterium]|uniref:MgtC/SapB family protein n=1 Tax=unclassified Undibacterium TaxID=2630295 RepID=UPI002AC93EAA|nr:MULTISPECIES: MgtC/SapB family protein [unclassified Undibacterium]MEB0140595.1 MgtC/SapB family protein [Undibacterium sp. CCC2.1]MEB0173649.1 MgtC/SapB family protein [Undibacterium sp. CCC1.1]MEB0177361.1 MgtC/SapB family protein [Undibacterium sp. CCC3.4]MEB0216773.1 MgtC/SapB family protein [Undibacterium sp. 5I2]WPX44549.1 MgtC/SapB family protein [Undibacterium sp. CCC3.4]